MLGFGPVRTPMLFRVVLVIAPLVVGLWIARARDWIGPHKGPVHAHEHEGPRLPEPVFGEGPVDSLVPRYQALPDFALIDAGGRPLDRARLAGGVWVASFLFTRCAGSCPGLVDEVRALEGALPPGVRLVSVSVDPTRDTPEVLAAYAAARGITSTRWLLATGTLPEVERLVVEGFGLGTRGQVLHSTRLALVDGAGVVRGWYESTDPEARARLLRDAALLL